LAVLALVLISVSCGLPPSPSANDAEGSVPPSPEPDPDPANDLAAVAWWATESLDFGVIPEAPPDPNPAATPGGFRQLAIGTLDGRVTAILALHPEWGHSYVAGPYGTDVLVANDIGDASEVFLISALDGTRTDLFRSEEIVAAAALGNDTQSVYYVEVGRAGGRDRGLQRRPVAGGEETTIIPGPLSAPEPDPAMFWLTAAPLANRAVVQSCFGEIRCASFLVDLETGQAASIDDLGWPLGAGAGHFFADGLEASGDATALDVTTGETTIVPSASGSVPVAIDNGWRFVLGLEGGPTTVLGATGGREVLDGEEPEGSAVFPLGERRGVGLPPGWVLRWPPMLIWDVGGPSGPPGGNGQLIDIAAGRRFDLGALELHVAEAADCVIPTPRAMPNGQPPGYGVFELVDGVRSVRWGPRDEAVVAVIGGSIQDAAEVVREAAVTVRGHEARAVIVEGGGAERPALTWTEAGCDVVAWLPVALTLDDVIAYADAY
jgi:hypothetical protein